MHLVLCKSTNFKVLWLSKKLNVQVNCKIKKKCSQFDICNTHAHIFVWLWCGIGDRNDSTQKTHTYLHRQTYWHNQSLSSCGHDDDDVVHHRHPDHQWKYIWISKLFLWLFHHHKFIMQPGKASGESSSCYATHTTKLKLHYIITFSFIHTDSQLLAFFYRDLKRKTSKILWRFS